jgi:signal transduction histidine kinase
VTFIREIPEDTVFVEIAEDKITQVLDNIISNAMKYSPEGGTITFRTQEYDDKITVACPIRVWEFLKIIWIRFSTVFTVWIKQGRASLAELALD